MQDFAINIFESSSITEGELAAILDSSSYGIRIIKKDFTVSYINKTFANLSGINPREATGKKCWQVFHGPLCNTSDCRLRRILDGDNLFQYEIERKRKDGSVIPCKVIAIPCYSRKGELTSMIEMFIDITERKQLEEHLRESKEKYEISDKYYKAIIQSAAEGFLLIKHPQGDILDVNDAIRPMTGYSRDELLSMKIQDIDIDFVESPEKISQRLKDIKKNDISTFEVRHRRKDGKIIDLAVTLKYLNIGSGLAFCFHRDITKQKEMYQRLKESEEKYRLLAENVIDIIYTYTLDGVYTYVSPSVKQLRGYTAEEAMAQKSDEVLTPESLQKGGEVLREALAANRAGGVQGQSIRTTEFELLCKDGSTVWAEVKTDFIRDSEGKPVGVVGVCRDITERKDAEKKLTSLVSAEKKLRRQLEEQIKRRIEFTRALMHDIKTPLTPLISASDFILSHIDEEPLKSFARQINKSALSLNTRVDELLDITRGEVGLLKVKLRKVDIKGLLHESYDFFKPVASERNLSLILDLPDELPVALADSRRIQQVIYNLLDNAIKYTPAGGQIKLAASVRKQKIVIEVQDSGPGISKKNQKCLFKPYKRLRRKNGQHGGLGLGLAICKTLIELHKESIWFVTEPGRGSTFYFSLAKYSHKKS